MEKYFTVWEKLSKEVEFNEKKPVFRGYQVPASPQVTLCMNVPSYQ